MHIQHTKPDMSILPGGWEPDAQHPLVLSPNVTKPSRNVFTINGGTIMTADDVFSREDCAELIRRMEGSGKSAPVSVQGFNSGGFNGTVGSRRATCWSEQFAEEFSRKMLDTLNYAGLSYRSTNHYTPTDWWQKTGVKLVLRASGMTAFAWGYAGISPLLRFMRYENGGEHYAHYDAGFIYENANVRTLMSFVLYLTDVGPHDGGGTRFIRDGQQRLAVWQRQHEDWTRPVDLDDVLMSVRPKAGRILMFDHRMCHDVQPYTGSSPRIIIRGDVVFQRLQP